MKHEKNKSLSKWTVTMMEETGENKKRKKGIAEYGQDGTAEMSSTCVIGCIYNYQLATSIKYRP